MRRVFNLKYLWVLIELVDYFCLVVGLYRSHVCYLNRELDRLEQTDSRLREDVVILLYS